MLRRPNPVSSLAWAQSSRSLPHTLVGVKRQVCNPPTARWRGIVSLGEMLRKGERAVNKCQICQVNAKTLASICTPCASVVLRTAPAASTGCVYPLRFTYDYASGVDAL